MRTAAQANGMQAATCAVHDSPWLAAPAAYQQPVSPEQACLRQFSLVEEQLLTC